MKYPLYCLFYSFLIFGLGFQPALSLAQNFKAAVVKKNITPQTPQMLLGYGARKSTGINDSIYHRIVVLDDGETKFFLVSSDICVVSPSEYDRVAAILNTQYGIPKMNFWWSLTHTHSAPEVGPPGLPEVFMGERYTHNYDTSYTNYVVDKIVEGIGEALSQLQPAKLGVGWGYSQANINRRARDIDNKAFLGMHPDGPVDRRIGILKISDQKFNNPMAIIANYPIHGTVMGGKNLLISGDAPGVVAEYVEEQTGAPMLFINGAAGNIAPIYSVYPSPQEGKLNQFRALLGDKIIKGHKNITTDISEISFQVGELILETPRKNGLSWPSDLKAYSHTTQGGDHLIKLPIRFFKVNDDIAIWGAPLELFCEISNEIRDRSPFPYTFYFGYTNGWLGYMLTEEELQYGGYEPSVSPYVSSAGKDLTEAVSAYLQGELKSK
ncbi:MAG: neutral/alkaline non-lysosomal ceramidase N-terminal domain-containing protein [Anditalea sp.]